MRTDRCVRRAASTAHPCFSPSMRLRLGSSHELAVGHSPPGSPTPPAQGRLLPGALLAHSLCCVTLAMEALLRGTRGWGGRRAVLPGVLPRAARATAGDSWAVSGQSRPLGLARVAVAGGPLLCQPWEAAEPAPSSMVDAACCIAVCRGREEGGLSSPSRVVEAARPGAVLGSGAVGCCFHGSWGRAGVLQEESREWGGDLLLCVLRGRRDHPASLGERGQLIPPRGRASAARGPGFVAGPRPNKTVRLPRGFQGVQEAAGNVGTGARPGHSRRQRLGTCILPALLSALQLPLLCCTSAVVLSRSDSFQPFCSFSESWLSAACDRSRGD